MEEERHRGMIRNLTRNLICFWAAAVLLVLMLCAVEVSLRAWRLKSGLSAREQIRELQGLTTPSKTTWIDVRPLMDLEHQTSPSFAVRIETNEHGLRAPSVVVPKPRGTYRVLCLGGDNVFGSTVVELDTLPQRMQRLLNRQTSMPVEVINAGCPQAGPLINLLRYRSHLASLQPDLVILCLSEEDLSFDHGVRGTLHLDDSRNPAFASHPALKGQGQSFLDNLCKEFVTVNCTLNWAGGLLGLRSNKSRAPSAPVRESLQRDLAAIVPLSRLVEGNFGRLVVSVSPSAWSVDRARNAIDKNQSSFAEDVRRFLRDVKLAGQVDVHDGLQAFCQVSDVRSYFSPETGGLSTGGNDLYAQQLSAFLLQSVSGLAAVESPPPVSFPPGATPRPVRQDDQSRAPTPATVIR